MLSAHDIQIFWIKTEKEKVVKKERFVWCQCVCGIEKWVRTKGLKTGKSRSCGCITRKEAGLKKRGISCPKYADGTGLLREAYRKVRNRALERNNEFSLSLEKFMEIVKKPCHYCTLLPANTIKTSRGITSIKVSGIDRYNNSLGYTEENSVPCCKHCNRAKSDLTPTEFYVWINRLKQVNIHD